MANAISRMSLASLRPDSCHYSVPLLPMESYKPPQSSGGFMAATTIQLSSELKRTLAGLKIHPRETYSDVVERLVEDLKELDKATLAEIEEARAEIRAGRYLTQDQVRKALGF